MKKHSGKPKRVVQQSLLTTTRRALVHVMVFGAISLTGHVATSALSTSLGGAGSSLAVPISTLLVLG